MTHIYETEKIDAFSLMFECARSLIGGAKIIVASDGIEENGVVKWPTIPTIVCSAFAIEIQIKALLLKFNCARPTGDQHDISLLFSALPRDLQDALLNFQVQYTHIPAERFREELNEHKDTFKRWRYPYETLELAVAPAFLFSFALALSEYIMQNYNIERSDNGWLGSPKVSYQTEL